MRRQARRGLGGLARNSTTYFGQVFTLDHFVTRGDMAMGCKGKKDVAIMVDLWYDYMLVQPVDSKATKHAYEALRQFRGNTYPQRVHTDNSPELIETVRLFGFHHTLDKPLSSDHYNQCK